GGGMCAASGREGDACGRSFVTFELAALASRDGLPDGNALLNTVDRHESAVGREGHARLYGRRLHLVQVVPGGEPAVDSRRYLGSLLARGRVPHADITSFWLGPPGNDERPAVRRNGQTLGPGGIIRAVLDIEPAELRASRGIPQMHERITEPRAGAITIRARRQGPAVRSECD